MHKTFLKISYAFITPVFLSIASFAEAAGIENPLGSNQTSIPNLVSLVLTYVTRVGGVVAIIAFIYAGFKFVQARGNETELKKAKDIFFWTVIGVAILLGAKLLADLVIGTIKSL